jgi:hypothetical protein
MAFSVNCLHLKFVGYAFMTTVYTEIVKEFCRQLRFYFTCFNISFSHWLHFDKALKKALQA